MAIYYTSCVALSQAYFLNVDHESCLFFGAKSQRLWPLSNKGCSMPAFDIAEGQLLFNLLWSQTSVSGDASFLPAGMTLFSVFSKSEDIAILNISNLGCITYQWPQVLIAVHKTCLYYEALFVHFEHTMKKAIS